MASKRGNSWRVRYQDDDGGWHSKTFRRKTDADRFEVSLKADRARGTWIDPDAGTVTFADFSAKYLATKNGVNDATRGNIEARLTTHILPRLGSRQIGQLRKSDILAWQSELKGTRANDTVNACLAVIRQVLDLAVDDDLIPRNVAKGVEPLPKEGHKEIRPATREQIIALSSAIDPRFAAAIEVAALGTGLRAGELWALKVERINFLRRVVQVVESIDDRGSEIITNTPKNGKTRSIRIDTDTAEALSRHLARYPAGRDGYVFTSAEGGPVRHRNFSRRHFAPATKACDLPARFRFHDLRHTHASLIIADGARPEQVKDRLGHGSIRTTYDWYSHLFDGHDDELLARIAEANRAARS